MGTLPAFRSPAHSEIPASSSRLSDAAGSRKVANEMDWGLWAILNEMDDQQFKLRADGALEQLNRKLAAAGDRHGFDVDLTDGALKVEFDEPAGRFVVSPNSPVRQIWVSALTKSFKLEWNDAKSAFVLPSSGQTLEELMAFAVTQHLGEPVSLP